MSAKTLELKRAAGEKREQAQKQLDTLRERIGRQVAGSLAEGETRLTNEEIVAQKQAIEALLAEAKSIEGLDDLDDLMNAPDGKMSAGARELAAGYKEEKNKDLVGAGLGKSHFGTHLEFLRHVRASGGDYASAPALSSDQRKALTFLKAQGAKLEVGEPIANMKLLGAEQLKTLVGDDPLSAGRGDYLVPPEFATDLLRVMGEQQQFANRARRVPMARRSVTFPRLVQTDMTDTRPMFGFAAVSKIAEAATKPEREPTFDQLTLTAVKYAAYVEASDELLADSIVDLPPLLSELMTSAIAYEFDRDTIRGTGIGEPLGWLNSPAAMGVPRAVANQVGLADIFQLEARFFGSNGIFLFNQSIIPQLYNLQQQNIVAWNSDLTAAVPGTLFGRPLVRTFKLPLLGTAGDLTLVDPGFYLVGEVQAITISNSIHYRFRNDVTAWRAVYRAGGTPWPAGRFSMEAAAGAAAYEMSPFLFLDDVAGP